MLLQAPYACSLHSVPKPCNTCDSSLNTFWCHSGLTNAGIPSSPLLPPPLPPLSLAHALFLLRTSPVFSFPCPPPDHPLFCFALYSPCCPSPFCPAGDCYGISCDGIHNTVKLVCVMSYVVGSFIWMTLLPDCLSGLYKLTNIAVMQKMSCTCH